MKAVITITGHLSSVQEISKALWRGNETGRTENSFGNLITIRYNSMRDARQALRYAWEELKEYVGDNDYITRDSLSYDVGRAAISRNH